MTKFQGNQLRNNQAIWVLRAHHLFRSSHLKRSIWSPNYQEEVFTSQHTKAERYFYNSLVFSNSRRVFFFFSLRCFTI